jgi:hypothetical protein
VKLRTSSWGLLGEAASRLSRLGTFIKGTVIESGIVEELQIAQKVEALHFTIITGHP